MGDKSGPLSLPSGDSLEHVYLKSTDLFPHVSRKTVDSIAKLDFPQQQLGILCKLKQDVIVRRDRKNTQHTFPSQQLIEKLPDVFAFTEAWAVFTAILQNERPDLPIAAALNGYMCTIIALAKKSRPEWPNVLNYHLAFFSLRARDPFFSPQFWMSVDPSLLEIHCPPRGLLRLNDDCLHYIIQWLDVLRDYSYILPRQKRKYPLKSLSLCCSRIRAACLPFLFGKISWPLKVGSVLMKDMVPDKLLGYIWYAIMLLVSALS
jgi:hypothetical protein